MERHSLQPCRLLSLGGPPTPSPGLTWLPSAPRPPETISWQAHLPPHFLPELCSLLHPISICSVLPGAVDPIVGEDGQLVPNASPDGWSLSRPRHRKAHDHDWEYPMIRTQSLFHSRVLGRFGAGSGWGFPDGSDGKESACNAGYLGSIPGLGRSPGGGHGNPLQYRCLENPMDAGTLRSESETQRKPEVPASPRGEALFRCARPSGVPRGPAQKSPDTPGSPEGNTEGPGTASSEPLLPS